ncbi:hypothetical protein C463_04866 [Halorubrum californiense DSM 19288]|uniref:Uncharacterized protein n=1 Tax=Halorubrum californiense DSM 19288 TaxID=1227465 RepID=M0EGT3_9EURY|nr:hypothetical protein C463_04866 [Halorubrum californiense DSM 19288]
MDSLAAARYFSITAEATEKVDYNWMDLSGITLSHVVEVNHENRCVTLKWKNVCDTKVTEFTLMSDISCSWMASPVLCDFKSPLWTLILVEIPIPPARIEMAQPRSQRAFVCC